MAGTIILDPDDGRIYFTVDIFDDLDNAAVIARDNELADFINNQLIPGKAQAIADGDNDLATVYQNKIDANTAWRADLGDASNIINELTNHRA